MDIDLYSIRQHVEGHKFWLKYLDHALEPLSQVGIHIAIFSEPFLTNVLQGHKTVESRFSRNRCAPYGEVADGDIILIKEVSGPICGLTLAQQTWFFNLGHESLDEIKRRFAHGICADEAFWDRLQDTDYATIIELEKTAPIEPVWCDKRDRRGWVSLRSRQMEFAF